MNQINYDSAIKQGMKTLSRGLMQSDYTEKTIKSWTVRWSEIKSWGYSVDGDIGWWAFSGDCLTDYISGKNIKKPRKSLEQILANYSVAIRCNYNKPTFKS